MNKAKLLQFLAYLFYTSATKILYLIIKKNFVWKKLFFKGKL